MQTSPSLLPSVPMPLVVLQDGDVASLPPPRFAIQRVGSTLLQVYLSDVPPEARAGLPPKVTLPMGAVKSMIESIIAEEENKTWQEEAKKKLAVETEKADVTWLNAMD